jgi:hypothetical protein
MRTLVIRGILLMLALSAVALMLFRNRLPFGKDNSSFACDPEQEITRIEFSSPASRLTLEKKGEIWTINGESEARKSGIMFILRVLREIKIKSPVTEEMFRSEITAKGTEPVRIKVYTGRKQIRSFLVYKTSSNSYGNIMKIRERSKPFIVYVPGYDGDIGSAFTLNELFWQPYTVFNLLPSEIASVDFENLSDTSASFKISVSNRHYSLIAHNHELSGWDTALVARYLSYFAWIPFEKWALDMGEEERKRVEGQDPLYKITVATTGGSRYILTLWEKSSDGGNAAAKDSDRLLGRTQNSREFFVMRYFDIDPLLKKRSYFYPE